MYYDFYLDICARNNEWIETILAIWRLALVMAICQDGDAMVW